MDVSLRVDGPQLDSVDVSRSTMLERHSRLDAPAAAAAAAADLSPKVSEKNKSERLSQNLFEASHCRCPSCSGGSYRFWCKRRRCCSWSSSAATVDCCFQPVRS